MSAIYGALIILIAGITVISYESDNWLLLAAVLGAFVGTYFAVKFKKK